MARTAVFLFSLLLLGIPTAQAQPRLYIATTTAVDDGERGNIPGGPVPSLGGLIGLRLTEALWVELEVERAFRTTITGSGESVLASFPPTRNPTREELELYGVRARFDRTQKAGAGWSAQTVWRSHEPGRINVGLLAGVSSRVYSSRVKRTMTFISPLVPASLTDQFRDETSTRRMAATGLTGGLLIFLRITRQLTVAPECRLTAGFITNDHYRVFRSGVRAMWSF